MKVNLGTFPEGQDAADAMRHLQALARNVERAFGRVPEHARQVYEVTLDFAAPGAVPGVTEQTATIQGVEVGDTVLVGAPVATPAGFIGPFAYVSAADTVQVVWPQLSGVAADPDGAGGIYRIDVWRH